MTNERSLLHISMNITKNQEQYTYMLHICYTITYEK